MRDARLASTLRLSPSHRKLRRMMQMGSQPGRARRQPLRQGLVAAAEAAMTAMDVAIQRRQGSSAGVSSEDMDREDGVLLHQVRCRGPLVCLHLHRGVRSGWPPGMHS